MKRSELYEIRDMIVKAATSLTDKDAAKVPMLFNEWVAPHHYEKDDRFTYGTDDKGNLILWKATQEHDSQPYWTPDVTPVYYTQVGQDGQGDDPSNPIPYNNNMELEIGKYYSQYDVVYHCFRDTGIPVYNNLADLVGLYVEVWVNE